jgi:hypothetical protein
MTYKLLRNGRGVPVVLKTATGGVLELEFQNAPADANAYIRTKNGADFEKIAEIP